jgi:sugar phosphate isomerase/epimerase
LDLPASAARAGLSAIECNDFMLPPPRFSRLRRPLLSLLPGAPPALWRYSRGSLDKLALQVRAHAVDVLAWTVNSDFTVSALHWPLQKLYLRRGVAAARRLEAPLLRVNLGGEPETPPERDALIARRLAAFVAECRRRYPQLTITVENHWGVSTDVDRHLRIVDAARNRLDPALRAQVGCCFDPGNVEEGDRERLWPELARQANHYHFKTTEFDEQGNDVGLPHEHLLSLLDDAGYAGAATIEYQGQGDALEGVRRSQTLFARLRRSTASP